MSSPLHLTVATVVERDGKYLFVEERINGKLCLNQPAGHVESGESLIEAAIREAYEETGNYIEIDYLIGVYRWQSNNSGKTYFRATFAGSLLEHDPHSTLDEGIERTLWLSSNELAAQENRLRSPLVSRCVQDYKNKKYYPLDLLVDL